MEKVVKTRAVTKRNKYIVCAILLFFLASSIVAVLFLTKPPVTLEEIQEIVENKEEPVQEENQEEPSTEQTSKEENEIDNKEETQKEEAKDPSKEENKTNNNTSKPNNNQNNNSSTNINTETKPSTTPEEEKEDKIEIEVVKEKNINLNNYTSSIKITEPGEYTLTGNLNYSVYVETTNSITLNLNGVNVSSKIDSAIANINDNLLTINLKEGTTNKIADASGIESKYDGCIFSNGEIVIDGTGTLNVYGNQIDGEGIATKNSAITINNGNINIYSVDDGLNTGGTGGTIMINNGAVYIEAGGDGIDSNQDIKLNGGTLHATGGSITYNGGMDSDAGITINGGTNIVLGTEDLQMPNLAEQYVIGFTLNESIPIGTILTLVDVYDNPILSFKANDKFKTVIISTNQLNPGTYYLYSGGTHTGTLKNGIYYDGIYKKGTQISINNVFEFIIREKITIYK